MVALHLDAEGRAAVAAAVRAAEATTDGEIVTVLAARSDAYHDVALHYAVAAMLLVTAVFAMRPDLLPTGDDGWGWDGGGGAGIGRGLFGLLVAQTLAFLLVRFVLAWRPLRLALTPRATRARRVRRQAVRAYRLGADRRTATREAVLLYLSLDEHLAEIVADERIHRRVAPEAWGEAMAALVDEVRAGRPAAGLVAGVERIGAVLATYVPKTESDVNELPDRLIEL
jgi:putative membrane protein